MLNWTNPLKASVKAKITALSITCYWGRAQPASITDLICYASFRGGGDGESDNDDSRNKVLQIDLWYVNKDKDLTDMDVAADKIDNAFNGQSFIESGLNYYCTQIADNDDLPTEDEFTFHRQLAYELQYNQ